MNVPVEVCRATLGGWSATVTPFACVKLHTQRSRILLALFIMCLQCAAFECIYTYCDENSDLCPLTGVLNLTDSLGFGFRPELLGSGLSIINLVTVNSIIAF